jgi:sulfite exporter TauE/SafE
MVSETLVSVTYIEALSIGLLYGTIFCTSECLPYLASYIAGTGAGFRKGILITLLYDAGRLISYTLIGVMVGIIGGSVASILDELSLLSFRIYSAYAIGIITILIGVHIFFRSRKNNYNCASECKNVDEWKIGKYDFRAFTLGLTRGLIICPPLFALLVFSVPFGSPLDSIAIAFLFGFGTILSPMLLLGGVTGWLLNKAPMFKKWISIIGSGALIVLGTLTIILTFMNSN